MPRSAIIWTRSRKLSLNVMYHLTHRMMISWSKCRPLNRSCAEVGSVIPAVIAGYRAFQQFAPEPFRSGAHELKLGEANRCRTGFVTVAVGLTLISTNFVSHRAVDAKKG